MVTKWTKHLRKTRRTTRENKRKIIAKGKLSGSTTPHLLLLYTKGQPSTLLFFCFFLLKWPKLKTPRRPSLSLHFCSPTSQTNKQTLIFLFTNLEWPTESFLLLLTSPPSIFFPTPFLDVMRVLFIGKTIRRAYSNERAWTPYWSAPVRELLEPAVGRGACEGNTLLEACRKK